MLSCWREWMRERLCAPEMRELRRRRVVHEEFRKALGHLPEIAVVLDAMQAAYGDDASPAITDDAKSAHEWTIGAADGPKRAPIHEPTSARHEAEHRMRPPPD